MIVFSSLAGGVTMIVFSSLAGGLTIVVFFSITSVGGAEVLMSQEASANKAAPAAKRGIFFMAVNLREGSGLHYGV